MQRLYSTFPDGWPGAGLAFLRAVAVVLTIQHAFIEAPATHVSLLASLQLFAALCAAMLLVGLWSPVAGVLMAVAEFALALSHAPDRSMHILLGTVGVALAMLGPGAWSVDARLFGRKRIQIPQR